MDPIKVAVVGGGLGGLRLANGLLKAGADVTVYERDASLAGRRQGYRLHLDARAGLALQQCLPPPSLELFQAVPDDQLTSMDPASLHRLSGELIKTWHPDLRALHALAEIDETFAVWIHTSPPVPAWPPSRVTVLGDAIHTMSPARGSGANTALQDAATLCRALSANEMTAAVADYETQMRAYGYQAVAASSQAEAEMGARRGKLAFWLYRRLAKGPA